MERGCDVKRATNTSQRGFTLIELMISLVLFSFAIAGLLSVAVSITQAYREQRNTITAEGSVRVPLDFLADAVRQASPGSSIPTDVQDAGTCAIGALTVTNNSSSPDELDIIYASGAVVTSTREVYDVGTTTLDVNDASQLSIGDRIIITNFQNSHLVEITNKSGDTLTLAGQCTGANIPSGGYPVNSSVIRAQHARFYIADLDGIPTLWMDPDSTGPAAGEPLAEGIEDFQVAVGADADGDGNVAEAGTGANDDEWAYNFIGDSAPTGTIRAVRITLVARTVKPLFGNVALFYPLAAEDRAAGGTPDAYRRRVLRTLVDMRNTGGSP
jgi:prepilin-type N-terminal cleavage/methylation domain-containing protein